MGNLECCQPRANAGPVEVKINTEGDLRSKQRGEVTEVGSIHSKPVVEICPLPADGDGSAADSPVPQPPAPVAEVHPCARRLESRTRPPKAVEPAGCPRFVEDGPAVNVVLRRSTQDEKFGFVNATRKDKKPVLVVASVLPNTPLGLWNAENVLQVRPNAEILSVNGAAEDIVAMREALRESLTITMEIQNMKRVAQPRRDVDLVGSLEPGFPGG
mmetsp:Transcript_78906/g.180505  ORF Transcript_78906/g.180505 Transcript_78906/m.180505 type:complete len:215 (+) Transcript_78906:55-699(+)